MTEAPSPHRRAKSRTGTQERTPHRTPGASRVLLTGAAGFVGREVLRQLRANGCEVVAVARHWRADQVPAGVIQVSADIGGNGWQRWCEGCSAAIHLVGIIREAPRDGVTFDRVHRAGTEQVVRACQDLGIKRLVHMSALGAREHGSTAYFRSKWQGEQAVRRSGLEWTIFRPSLIFGPGDGLSSTLAPALQRSPVFPVFGDGAYRVQPIAVEEVARCFVTALEVAGSVGETYELGGPEALTFDELLRRIAAALGLHRPLVHIPLWLARPLVSLMQHFPDAPISRDQLTMLLEGSTCDTTPASLVFGVSRARYEGPTWLKEPGTTQ